MKYHYTYLVSYIELQQVLQLKVRISLKFIKKEDKKFRLFSLIAIEFQGVEKIFVAANLLVMRIDIKVKKEAKMIVVKLVVETSQQSGFAHLAWSN
jgi:hypothetical protein